MYDTGERQVVVGYGTPYFVMKGANRTLLVPADASE